MRGSYLFVFRAYPDVDHMSPVVWKLLEQGEEVHGIVSPGYDPTNDRRLNFLQRYPGFHLHQVAPGGPTPPGLRGAWAQARELLRRTLPWATWFVARHNVRVVAVEWGYGFRPGYGRLASAQGVLDVLRSSVGSFRRRGAPRQTRTNFAVAARLLGRATLCLPHGLSVKLGRGGPNGNILPGPLEYRDRNLFSVYVLNTEHHREWFLTTADGDPAVMQNWGSVRWAPEWFELNRQLAPRFDWPRNGATGDPVKVVYMVPKWANHVDKDAALALVKRLQRLDGISVAVKAHPRPEGNADPLRDDPEIDWDRLHLVSAVDSVSLIEAADVIIDVGSSIGIEVLMQGKVLLNPTYIHDFYTLFDDIPDSSIVAHNEQEVVDYLERHVAGEVRTAPDDAVTEVLRRGVYGSRPEPYDVLGDYTRRVRELTRQSH